MFHFPPTAWEVHGLSFGPATGGLLIVLAGTVAAALVRASGVAASAIWAFAGTCVFFQLVVWLGRLDDVYAPPYPVDILVMTGVMLACGMGALLTLVRNTKRTENGGRAMMAGTVLAVVCWGAPTLFPACVSYRVATARTACRNNLKQVGLAMHNYHDVYQMFPPAWQSGPLPSWRVSLLPFLDRQKLFEQYDSHVAWNSPTNLPISEELVRSFDCPQRPQRLARNNRNQFHTAYVVPIGSEAVFDGLRRPRIRDITDGTSNTFLAVEACGMRIPWSEPRDVVVGKALNSVNVAGDRLDRSDSLISSYHRGGAQVLLGDGSVRFISQEVDQKVLRSLLTARSGDRPGSDW